MTGWEAQQVHLQIIMASTSALFSTSIVLQVVALVLAAIGFWQVRTPGGAR
jgi:hypothetical protein